MKRTVLTILGTGIVCLGAILGCGTKAKTPAEYFQEEQGSTMTPHGRIKSGSVKAVKGNRIQYETEEGNVFQVTYEKEGGRYRYSAPKKVK